MPDAIASTAKEVAALVSADGGPRTVCIDRSTRLSEWSLMLALVGLIAFVLLMFAGLLVHPWPQAQAAEVIHYLGRGLFLAIGGVLLVVVAIASPYIGRVQASAGTAKLDLEGRA